MEGLFARSAVQVILDQPRLLQAELPVKRDKHPLAFCVRVPRVEEVQKCLPHEVIPKFLGT